MCTTIQSVQSLSPGSIAAQRPIPLLFRAWLSKHPPIDKEKCEVKENKFYGHMNTL